MRVRFNPNVAIQQIRLSGRIERGMRWVGWTHLYRRTKERLFPKATIQDLDNFYSDVTAVLASHLLGENCMDGTFIAKMGTFGLVCSVQKGVLTITTLLRVGGWAFKPGYFASAFIGEDKANSLYSDLYGVYLNWKGAIR